MASILICDDEPVTLRGLKRFLKRERHLCFTAINAREALGVLRKKKIDILITDVRMPVIDGFSLLEMVKKEYPGVKIIVITGYYCIKDAVRAIKLGASDYITKPISLPDLGSSVESLMEERELAEEGKVDFELSGLTEEEFDSLIRALYHPLRRKIVSYLATQKEKSFSLICDELKIEEASVLSFHLRNLKLYGLVTQNKSRKYVLTGLGAKAAGMLRGVKKTL